MMREAQCLDRSLEFLKIWHAVFSKNLEYVVGNIQEAPRLTPEIVGDDSICQTGRWFATQSPELLALESCRHLAQSHRAYHGVAAQVMRLHREGAQEDMERLLEGPYAEASAAVSSAIDVLSGELQALGVYPKRFGQPPSNGVASIWSESFEIGVPSIDRGHHAIAMLIDQVMVNGDLECMSSEARNFLETLARMISNDIRVENEELLLLRQGDVDCSAHIEAHRKILEYLSSLGERIAKREVYSLDEVGRYLANWYIDHLVTFDLDL